MKLAGILGIIAVIGAFMLPPNNTVNGCAEAIRKATHVGVVHECDGLSAEQQAEAWRLSGRGNH